MRIYTLLLVLILFYSCSPVSRTVKVGSIKKIPTAKPIETTNSNINKTSDNQILDNDTIDIVLPEVKISVKSESKSNNTINNYSPKDSDIINEDLSIENLLDQAIDYYENQEITKSRNVLEDILSKIKKSDEKYLEVLYYLAECDISENKLTKAKEKLNEIYKNKNVDSQIMEKVLLRLGQIFCYEKNNTKATEYFKELKSLNPNSILNKLANCNFIKK
jgi:tetratricopeptide (TPR) repeat protein